MKERKWELDMIRVISCFFVIVIHVTSYGMELKEPSTFDWGVRNVVLCSVRCAVPVFFMLSGILLLEREIPVGTLYKKYVLHLVTVWCAWSAFYAGIDAVAVLNKGGSPLACFLERFWTGHYHLWFLSTLIGVYLLYPVLRVLVRYSTNEQMKYLGVLVLAAVVIRKTLDPFVTSTVWITAWEHLGFPEFSSGIIYFVLGHYLHRSYQCFSPVICTGVYVGSIALMSIVNQLWRLRTGSPINVTYDYSGLGIFLTSSSFMVLLLHLFQNCQISDKMKQMTTCMSKCTFGIYLIHTLFIEQVYRRIGLTQERFPVVISIVCFSVLTFVLSFSVTWCARRAVWMIKNILK